jgi:hypothetical protein
VIWVISDIERVSGGKTHEDLLSESIKACQRGFCRDIALVVTKTDKLHLQEYLRYSNKLVRFCRASQPGDFLSWVLAMKVTQALSSDCEG